MKLHKPDQRPQVGVGPERSTSLQANVDRLLSGEDVENDGYDSDDGTSRACVQHCTRIAELTRRSPFATQNRTC